MLLLSRIYLASLLSLYFFLIQTFICSLFDVISAISELEKIIEDKKSDKEMVQLAKSELNVLLKKNDSYEKVLKLYLLPKDEADSKNAILEIRAGTGGLEATLDRKSTRLNSSHW